MTLSLDVANQSRMERYGFFLMSHSDGECGDFTYLHGTLFEHAHQCLRVARDWKTDDKKSYFKMLNNSEIVKYAHVKQNKKKFGYLFLTNDTLNTPLFVHTYSSKLYDDILECIYDGKSCHEQTDDHDGYTSQKDCKIGYFLILSDDELVAELHAYL